MLSTIRADYMKLHLHTVFKSDQLTSQPLNLSYTPADNIWLSFFYQAGGLGDSPEPNDSLTLQFLAPEENKWYSVWKADGTTDQVIQTCNNQDQLIHVF